MKSGLTVRRFNHERYYEVHINLTPADVYAGKEEVLSRREQIKENTVRKRRQENLDIFLLIMLSLSTGWWLTQIAPDLLRRVVCGAKMQAELRFILVGTASTQAGE
jgi:hypothetical protein